MTYKLKAHWEGDAVVLDEPAPAQARAATPYVIVEADAPLPTGEERMQSASGFVSRVLLDPAEDAWEND
jgi:hypothetical protein